MSKNKVHVGTPSSNFEDWTTTDVCFHGFADLSTTRGERVGSPQFLCFGHQWRMFLYPGGRANSDDGFIAVKLANMSNQSIKIQYGYSVRDTDGKEVVHHESKTFEFDAKLANGDGVNSWGKFNFAPRSWLLDALIGGSLIVEVRMKPIEASKLFSQFIPENPINKNILNKFNDEESADIIFEVGCGSKQGKGTRKKSKTSTNFYAHRLLLQDGASTLAEMCKPSGEGSVATVAITDVKPDVFKQLLFYLYGGKLPDEDLESNVKDIIDAADKYGIVSLKLEAEAFYVKSTKFTVENMIDNLLYADSKNLALLTEEVTDFIVEHGDDIIGKVSFDNVPSSMITDILAAVSRGKKNSNDCNNGTIVDYNKMRVGTLRKMLHEKGLDVDGSREAMISALKASGEDSE